MSKYIKFFALAGAALLLGACQEDLGLETGTITPGNEILFGANAYFENGEPQTRTEYGDIQGNRIEVLWVPGEDRMDIACPQAVGAPGHQAEYMVSELENDTTSGWNGDHVAGNDRASVLVRKSAVGLQWSTSRTHNFYAAYPSKNQIAERAVGKLPQDQIGELGMTVSYNQETNEETATLRGFIPVDQSPAAENITGDKDNGWEVKPDMTYAYMVANASHTYGAGSAVSLTFQPQVTALEFEIISSDLTGTGSGTATYPEFTILGAQLFSRNGQQMAGQFTYTFPLAGSGTGQFETVAANGYEKITQTFGDGLPVAKNQSVKATFFMLPGVTFNSSTGDLALTVIYKVGNAPQVKTATLIKEIPPKKKYFFSNVKLPAIEENISGSTWFSALAPKTLFSQVSIPVAGNVFANSSYGVTDAHFVQQSQTIENLWNMGVRGFEICTATAMKGKKASSYNNQNAIYGLSLGDQKVLVAEEDKYTSYTFNNSFDKLVGLLKKKNAEGDYVNKNECLVVLCSYMASGDGYNPYTYVSNLFNYLTAYVGNNSHGLTMDDFVQITSSSTAEDLRGKIAIVIRPGEDKRWLYETAKYKDDTAIIGDNSTPLTDPFTTLGITSYSATTGLTAQIPSKLTSDWWSKVLMIADWGTASYDRWDRRYGNDWASAATFDDLTPNDRKLKTAAGTNLYQMEQFLYGTNKKYVAVGTETGWAHSGSTSDNNFNYYGQAPTTQPTATTNTYVNEFNMAHSLSNGGTAYVQEWMRVIPDDGIGPICIKSEDNWGSNSDYSFWVKWPGSLAEKKEAIKDLFNKSVETKGNATSNDLYINVLTGYYPIKGVINGLMPFKTNYTASQWTSDNISNQGKGGDFKTLASDLNTYVYNLLTAKPDGIGATQNYLKQTGPWGLVVMDHIASDDNSDGTDGVSRNLVDLIMLNNFKFPLATKTTNQSTPPEEDPKDFEQDETPEDGTVG